MTGAVASELLRWDNQAAGVTVCVGLAPLIYFPGQARAALDRAWEQVEGARESGRCTRVAPQPRRGAGPEAIRAELGERFGYELQHSADDIRPGYAFDVTCQGSVPQAITCALQADSFEQAVRLAVSLGGDADTQAAIAGAIAEARFGGVPEVIEVEVRRRLSGDLVEVLDRFRNSVAERSTGRPAP